MISTIFSSCCRLNVGRAPTLISCCSQYVRTVARSFISLKSSSLVLPTNEINLLVILLILNDGSWKVKQVVLVRLCRYAQQINYNNMLSRFYALYIAVFLSPLSSNIGASYSRHGWSNFMRLDSYLTADAKGMMLALSQLSNNMAPVIERCCISAAIIQAWTCENLSKN